MGCIMYALEGMMHDVIITQMTRTEKEGPKPMPIPSHSHIHTCMKMTTHKHALLIQALIKLQKAYFYYCMPTCFHMSPSPMPPFSLPTSKP